MTKLINLIKAVRDAWMILGIALVLLLIMEVCFTLAFQVKKYFYPPERDVIENQIKADTYGNASWVAPLFQEIDESGRYRWKSYSYFRMLPYNGKYINIDSDGLRQTYSYPAHEKTNSKIKVFMFGGSTTWGYGVRDHDTIPSIFAKEAQNKEISCEVTNFGQMAYVSTQEVIELMLQLREGIKPDVVIFYDGVNDMFSAFQLGVAGLPMNEFNRDVEFNLLQNIGNLRTVAATESARQSRTLLFFRGAVNRFGLLNQNKPFEHSLYFDRPISDKSQLVREAVERYMSNISLVHALSKHYNFKCLFYWQPNVLQKAKLTESERIAMEIEDMESKRWFYENINAQIKQRAASLKNDLPFYDISSIFSRLDEPIYVDWCHLGEKGNTMIAQRMVEDFARIVKATAKTPEQNDLTVHQSQ